MNRIFNFQGVDFKTEMKIASTLVIPILLVLALTFSFFHFLFPKTYFLYVGITAVLLALSIAMLFLQLVMRFVKDKTWQISINKDDVTIRFRKNTWAFKLQDIRVIKNMGSFEFRYLTIITRHETIKIRVGNTGLTPFSTEEDINKLDDFVAFLKPYIDEGFNKKILKNRIDNDIFPNCGVYVVKTEKIKYNVINKLTFNQYVIVFGLGGVLLVILFTFILLKLMDYIISK